jgi:hypothetical protein
MVRQRRRLSRRVTRERDVTYTLVAGDLDTTITNIAPPTADRSDGHQQHAVPLPELDIAKTNVNDDADGLGDVSVGDTITHLFSGQHRHGESDRVTVVDDLLRGDALRCGQRRQTFWRHESGTPPTRSCRDLDTTITNIATADSCADRSAHQQHRGALPELTLP